MLNNKKRIYIKRGIIIIACISIGCQNISQNKSKIQSITIEKNEDAAENTKELNKNIKKNKSDTTYFKKVIYNRFSPSGRKYKMNQENNGVYIIKTQCFYDIGYPYEKQKIEWFIVPFVSKDSLKRFAFGPFEVNDTINKIKPRHTSWDIHMYAEKINSEVIQYKVGNDLYDVYKTSILNCYDGLCGAKHGHFQSEIGKFYFSPIYGVLLSQDDRGLNTVVLSELNGLELPRDLIVEVLKDNNFNKRIIDYYKKQ